MDKISVGFRNKKEIGILYGEEIQEQIYNLVLKVMLNYAFTDFYIYRDLELNKHAEQVLLFQNEVIKKAKRKHIIRVMPQECEITERDMTDGVDDVIRIDKDYDDWLLEHCDLIVGDDSAEFYESGLYKKAQKLSKMIVCLNCHDNGHYFRLF